MSNEANTKPPVDSSTLATETGRNPEDNFGIVNPPVYHASTVLFPTVEAFESRYREVPHRRVTYGLHGTPTTFALEEAVTELEGGYGSVVTSSGLSAITTALLAFLSTGDDVLVSDSVYAPTREFCDETLARLGIAVRYFDPRIGENIADLIQDNTRVVFLESPGSLTFEVQDTPQITRAARRAGAVTILDNTWATPLYFRAFDHEVDVSLHAATKYLSGHADLMLGLIVTNEACYEPVRQVAMRLGQCAGPDDVYLTLRGIRTLNVRLERHFEQGVALASWLENRPEVKQVLHPALDSHPDHEIWRRDFGGASGLFGFILNDIDRPALLRMVNGMALFGIGASWGGYESLMIPVYPERYRTATAWPETGPVLRVHVGLASIRDLIEDFERGFDRLNQI